MLESVSGVVEVVCAREYSGGVVTCEEERVEGGRTVNPVIMPAIVK